MILSLTLQSALFVLFCACGALVKTECFTLTYASTTSWPGFFVGVLNIFFFLPFPGAQDLISARCPLAFLS